MPVKCELRKGKWVCIDPKGKVHGTHDTKKKCEKQMRAINMNLHASEEHIVYLTPKDCEDFKFAEEAHTYTKELLHVGRFKKGDLEFEIEESTLKHMSDESNRMLGQGIKIPVPIEHTTDPEKNRGEVLEFHVRENSRGIPALFGKMKFRDQEASKLTETVGVSIYSPGEYTDGVGNRYVRPVRHVALTDYPVIPGMDNFTPIAASFITPEDMEVNPMLKDLAAKVGLELSEDILSDEDKVSEAILLSFNTLHENVDSLTAEVGTLKKDLEDSRKEKQKFPVSTAQKEMLAENRELKLSSLADNGNITEAVKKKLEEIFCTPEQLTLCLSEDHDDLFNKVVKALKDNEPLEFGEKTGQQLGGDHRQETSVLAGIAEKRAQQVAN